MTEVSFFEKIERQFSKDLPFVIYSRPINRFIKSWLQKDDALHTTSDFSESGFVFAPFDLKKDTVLFSTINCDHFQIEIDKLTLDSEFITTNSSVSESNKTKHLELVNKGIKAINAQKFNKVVLSRFTTLQTNEHPITIFKRLFNTYENAMVYCWYHPKVGMWVGATPELLFKTVGQQLTAISLAGTQPYSSVDSPKWTDKEIKEQGIVTNYLVEQIAPFVVNSRISDVETIRAGSLWHLKSRITSQIKSGAYLKSIIEALHPTPAVCGQPKEVAKDFILQNEDYDREFYTGFLGELNLKHYVNRNKNRRNIENNAYASVKTISNFYVNLRCAKLKDGEAKVYVGGGILRDSNAIKEWEETQNKTKTIASILG